MKTQFRLLTILFSLGLLSFFGFMDFILIKLSIERPISNLWQFIGIIILTLLVLAGLISIQRLTKIIIFNTNSVTFNWIFRNKRLEYKYQDIIGFQWSTLNAQPADYKQIIFYTADKKKIGFSDFECENFYELEDFIKNKFEIFHSYTQKSNEDQKKIAYEISYNIDLRQIKMINIALITLWLLIGFIFYMTIKDLNSASGLSNGRLIIALISILILILSVKKYLKERKRKHRITVYNPR
jgi:hypothetical protein